MQTTQISYSTTPPGHTELQKVYSMLESRASFLLGGWNNRMGNTPDDLAQVAMFDYVRLTEEGRYPEEAYRLVAYGLKRDVANLFQKEGNNATNYFGDAASEDPEDPEDDPGEEELAAVEASWIYFPPDVVDQMADLLTPRELETIIMVFEDELTHEEVSLKLRITKTRVGQLVSSALKKLRKGGIGNG